MDWDLEQEMNTKMKNRANYRLDGLNIKVLAIKQNVSYVTSDG